MGARCESEKWMAEVAAEAEAETGAEIEAWRKAPPRSCHRPRSSWAGSLGSAHTLRARARRSAHRVQGGVGWGRVEEGEVRIGEGGVEVG